MVGRVYKIYSAAAAVEEEKPKAATKTAFNVKLESFDAGSKVKIIKGSLYSYWHNPILI